MTEPEHLRAVRRFVRDELVGNEHELDALTEMPLPLYARFAGTGLTNWWLPKEHGGLGAGGHGFVGTHVTVQLAPVRRSCCIWPRGPAG